MATSVTETDTSSNNKQCIAYVFGEEYYLGLLDYPFGEGKIVYQLPLTELVSQCTLMMGMSHILCGLYYTL